MQMGTPSTHSTETAVAAAVVVVVDDDDDAGVTSKCLPMKNPPGGEIITKFICLALIKISPAP